MRKTISKIFVGISMLTIIIAVMAFRIPVTKSMSLIEAINSNAISATITSIGKYSGNCVNLKLINNTNSPLTIIAEGGTKYHPEDDGEQTLIQIEDNVIAIQAKQTYSGKIAAFCSEATDRCPSEHSKMVLSKNTNLKFDKLIEYLKDKHVPKTTYQDAVWAISDNKSISNISIENSVSKNFRTYMAELTGQKNTWFASPQNVQVDDRGNLNYETVNINGELEFDCTMGARVRQDVMKSNGEPMFESDKTMTAQTTHIRYKFRMSVRGWETGDYYIKIHDGINTLAKYEFSI